MKILVTGADGFVGGFLIQKLAMHGHELFLIGADIHKLKENYIQCSSCLSYLNLEHSKLTHEISDFSPEIAINLAAYSTSGDSYEDMNKLINANILFLGKLLDALKRVNLKCFIYTGSCTEYFKGDDSFNPAYLYSATKTAGRSILNYFSDMYNFKSVFITPYTVYGGITSQKKIIDIIYDSLDSENPVNTTRGEQILDFIHVSDLVDLYNSIVANIEIIPDRTNFHAGTGKGNSIRTMADIFEKMSNKKANINWGGIPYRKKDTMNSIADISKQKELLNWQPRINLEDGIKMYLDIKNKKHF